MKVENKAYICWIAFLALFTVCSFIIGTCSGQSNLVEIGNASGHGTHTMEVSGINISNMSMDETMVLFGPRHNFNVSKEGVLTLENNTRYQIKEA